MHADTPAYSALLGGRGGRRRLPHATTSGCSPEISRAWFRPGQWHHVAAQWDREAVRFYLDGAGGLFDGPSPAVHENAHGHPPRLRRKLPGVVRHVRRVRLSDIQRYGPLVPTGARVDTAADCRSDANASDAKADPPNAAAPPPDFAKEAKGDIGERSAAAGRRDRLRCNAGQAPGAGRQGFRDPARHAGQGMTVAKVGSRSSTAPPAGFRRRILEAQRRARRQLLRRHLVRVRRRRSRSASGL